MNYDAEYASPLPTARQDPPGILGALMAGFGAAIVGAIVWAVIVAVTDYELGFIAWGIGLLVGFSMSRSTTERSHRMALAAAAFAVAGLVVGKLAISFTVLPAAAAVELEGDPDFVLQAAAFQLQMSEGFPSDIQAELEALAAEDTLSDALWARMLEVSQVEVDGWSPEERTEAVEAYTYVVFGQMGVVDVLAGQASPYDLLWLLLAVSTAWKMMAKEEEEPARRPVPGDSGGP